MRNGNVYPFKGLYGYPQNSPLDWPYWENLMVFNGKAAAATATVYSGILVPDGVHHMLGLVWGGGASGASRSGQDGSSTGGGGGGFAAGILDVQPGTILPDITVGSFTAGVVNAVGTAGTSSSIGTLLSATGGNGGNNGIGSANTSGGTGGLGTANTRIGFVAQGGRGGATSNNPATCRKGTGGGGAGWFWCPPEDMSNGRNRGGDLSGNTSQAVSSGGGGLGGRGGDSNQALFTVGTTPGGGLGGRAGDHNATSGNTVGGGGSRGNGNNSHPTSGQGLIPYNVSGGVTTFTNNEPNFIDILRSLVNMFAFAGHGRNTNSRKLREFIYGSWGEGTLNTAGTTTISAPLYGGGALLNAPGMFGASGGNASNAGNITTHAAGMLAGSGGGVVVGSGVDTITIGAGGIGGGGGGARGGAGITGTATSGDGGPGLVLLAWTVGY